MRRGPAIRRLLAAALAIGACAPAAAHADALQPPLGITCVPQSDGTRFCQGSTPVASFDGQPLDVNVSLPAARLGATDGGYPLVLVLHGYGGQKKGFDDSEASWFPSAHEWAKKGYAVLNFTDRGFNGSCGSPNSRLANPQGCSAGFVRLMDTRYEVRDAQYLAGLLADQGWIDPQRIAATGESYGGGDSLALATLKDRMEVTGPNGDDSDDTNPHLVPWTSPAKHLPMRIAAATPTIPWSDLISSLLPNGHDLDYALAAKDQNFNPIGVLKQSFVAGLFATGQVGVPNPTTFPPNQPIVGYYAPPRVPQYADWDLNSWFTDVNAGEPYAQNPDVGHILDVFQHYHGAFYLLNGVAAGPDTEPPAPLLLSSGFTDDLFPADETIRYYNLERSLFPDDPVSLVYMDYGHQRGTNKGPDVAYLKARIEDWVDHYVGGTAPDPGRYVTAFTQTCPKSAASGGPFTGPDWFSLHPGQLAFSSAAAQTVVSGSNNPQDAQVTDPIAASQTNNGACSTEQDNTPPGGATYDLPTVTGGGYTMLGFPTVTAHLVVQSADPTTTELVARLWDVDSDGTRTLVTHSVFRPGADVSTFPDQVFQLHANGWHFAAGHHPKLELVAQDPPYVRKSNSPFTITVSNLRLVLPTRETSGNGITPFGAQPLPVGAIPAPGAKTYRSSFGGGSARAVACQSLAKAVRGAAVRPQGRGLRFTIPRGARVTVAVFQASHGRRTYSFRPIARFPNRRRSFTWNGRRATDGMFTVRFLSGRDERRHAVERLHGRFRARPSFDDEETCGSLAFFRLDYPVFGGLRGHRLYITFRLRENAPVRVRALVGRHVVRTWTVRRAAAARVYRLVLSPRGIRLGRNVRVELSARFGKRSVVRTLTSLRL